VNQNIMKKLNAFQEKCRWSKLICMRNFCLIFFAILPPLFESGRQFRALLDDPRLVEKLGSSEPILVISRTETGYRVETQSRLMDVEIHYGGDRRIIGPAQFRFEFSDPVLR
jgi:hypothetical protein